MSSQIFSVSIQIDALVLLVLLRQGLNTGSAFYLQDWAWPVSLELLLHFLLDPMNTLNQFSHTVWLCLCGTDFLCQENTYCVTSWRWGWVWNLQWETKTVCEQTIYIIVYCECLLAVALGWVLVHSLSWYLEDSSKTSLLLEPYTHHNRTETVVPPSHM